MEKRAYIRYPVQLNAVISQPNSLPRPCYIRDYCAGGMFISLMGQTKNHPVYQAMGQFVNIQFAVPMGDRDLEYQLKAKIVRILEGGVGVAFIAPDPAIIQSMNQLVTDTQAAPSGKTPLGKQHKDIINTIKDIASEQLTQLFNDFALIAEDTLFTKAEEASNNAAQMQYIDAIPQLRQCKEEARSHFILAIGQQIDHIQKLQDVMVAEDEASLSLLAKTEFEDWLAMSGIIAKTESRLQPNLDALNSQLTKLYQQEIDNANNPLGPASMCYQFQQGFASVHFNSDVLLALYQTLETPLLETLQTLYQATQTLLDGHGISVQDEQAEKREHKEPQKISVRDAHTEEIASESPRQQSEQGSHKPTQEDLSEAQRDITLELYRVAKQLASLQSDAQTKTEPVAYFNQDEILDALNHLPKNQKDQGDLKPQLLAFLEEEGKARQLDDLHLDRIDVVDTLFDAIQSDDDYLSTVKPWFDKLQIPVMKTAVVDDHFFQQKSHPARQAMNQFSKLALTAGDHIANRPVRQAAEHLIEKVADDTDGQNAFKAILPDLDQLVDQQTKLYNHNVDLVMKSCVGQQKRQKAQSHVQQVVHEQINHREIPSILASLLEWNWIKLLELLYLRAPDGQQYHECLMFIGQFCQLAPGRIDPETQQYLLNTLEDGLSLISVDSFQNKRFIQACQAYFCGETDIFNVKFSTSTQEKKSYSDEYQSALNAVKRIHIGDWFLFALPNKPSESLKLIWISDDLSQYVFVNARGMKAASLSEDNLVSYFHSAYIHETNDPAEPILDRVLYEALEKMNHEMLYLASHDKLTDLINREEFEKRLKTVLQKTTRQPGAHHLLCHLDLDQFKIINTTCSYKAGDQALIQVSKLIQKNIGEQDLLARFGGNEFGILFIDYIEDQYQKVEHLRQVLQSERFWWEDKHFYFGASIGVVDITDQSPTASELLQAADSARYSAKDAGRNRISVYEPDNKEMSRRQDTMHWVARINQALDKGALDLRCQRISPVDTDKGLKGHYEILLSVYDESGKCLPPFEFIQAAELYHRMADVDQWVISTIFSWIAENREKMDELEGFAVNLSGHSINDDRLIAFIQSQFDKTGISPHWISFEVTETVAIANIDKATNVIQSIKDIGCEFSLDDFGSGLASYAYLKTLPFDYVKIDGIFIKELEENLHDRALVKSINEVAQFMGKKTIAEYVENDGILAILKEIGVDFAQGYGIQKPVMLSDI